MVDVGAKEVTQREAVASATVILGEATRREIWAQGSPKGDVLAVARVAGIQAAKRCADLIPLCHPLPVDRIQIDFETPDERSVRVVASVRVSGKTGVEMEALTAASVSALTIYDMCKAINKGIVITDVRLERKTGGKSGTWRRD